MTNAVSLGWALNLMGAMGVLSAATTDAQTTQVASATSFPPPAITSTNVQDYSQGFRAFIRMGMPDTSKAKYVKLENYNYGMNDMSYRMHELQLSGSAWLISENKDDKSFLVFATGKPLELFDQKSFYKKQEIAARSNAVAQAAAKKGGAQNFYSHFPPRGNSLAEFGTWVPVDLSRDLAKATTFVDKKITAKAAGGREMRYDPFLQTDEPAGMLFMLAAFAWQNGKTQEANILAGRLFTLVGDSRKVIVGALNVMADAQLSSSMDAFRKTGDWNVFNESVSGLIKKYPAGWRQVGAAKMLADRLQARVTMGAPPALKAEGLDEVDLNLAAALVSEKAGMPSFGGGEQLWILPPAKAMQGMKDTNIISRIKARGLKSIPLLLALVPDETLCPLRRNDLGFGMSYSSASSDNEKPEAERALMYYNRLDRPVTRGEIARALLAPLCPHEQNSHQDEAEQTPEEVIAAAQEVYDVLKPLAPSGYAKHFLSVGDQNQKRAAISYLIQNDIETNASAIEAFLLTPPTG